MAEADPGPDPEVHHDPGVGDDTGGSSENSKTHLEASMKIGKLVFNVSLGETKLSWVKRGKTADKAVSIPIEEILNVNKITRMKSDGSEVIGFTISCVRHMKKNILKREMVQFLCDSETGEAWSQKIQTAIEQVQSRPKQLLVIINPESGSKNGRKIYNSKVSGLLKQANIETDVVVTERAHHCEEILSSYDLFSINGIVLVGGDGLYHEAVNGLIRRLTKGAGWDENDASIAVPVIPVPIGLIPVGTGNGIATKAYGCTDVETAALSIIIVTTGKVLFIKRHRMMDLCVEYLPPLYVEAQNVSDMGTEVVESDNYKSSANQSNSLDDTYNLNVQEAIGTCDSEKLINGQSYTDHEPETANGQETVIANAMDKSDAEQLDSAQGHSKKVTTTEKSDTGSEGNKPRTRSREWKTCQGIYTGVMIVESDHWNHIEKSAPKESCTRLILNKPSSGLQVLGFLVKLMTRQPNALDNNLTDNMQVKEVKIKLNNPSEQGTENAKKEHIVDLDGEIFHLKHPECHVVYHSSTVKLFVAPTETN